MSSSAFLAACRKLWLPIAAMGLVVLASNILVQYPVTQFGLQDYLTFGTFSYPFAFLVTDLTNRRFGAERTRLMVYVGFFIAVALSMAFAGPRIALASGGAFLLSQLLDVTIFDRLRQAQWWKAPFLSSLVSSALDTAVFFTFAFAGTDLPWTNWAVVDYLAKLVFAALMIAPYGWLRGMIPLLRGEPNGRAA